MKALVAPSYGPLDQLTFAERPVPEPGPGQVLIRVRAAALNPLDVKLITGTVREVFPVEHPFIPGMDVAGTVESVGDGVTEYAPGDEVAAFTVPLFGALAEYALAPVGPTLAHRPAALEPTRAAALPAAAMTAATMIAHAGPMDGRTVLIVGATGGVGSFAVQLAARAGARVIATATPDDDKEMRALGARHTIDYTATNTAAEAVRFTSGGVDIAIDLVNVDLDSTLAAVADNGRLVSLMGDLGELGRPGEDSRGGQLDRGIAAVRSDLEAEPGSLTDLLARAAADELTVPIAAVYAFAEADRALADLAGKHTTGKLAVSF